MLASLSKGCSSLVPPSFLPSLLPVIFLFLPPLLLRIGLYLFFDEVHVRRREMYSQAALDRIPIPRWEFEKRVGSDRIQISIKFFRFFRS